MEKHWLSIFYNPITHIFVSNNCIFITIWVGIERLNELWTLLIKYVNALSNLFKNILAIGAFNV